MASSHCCTRHNLDIATARLSRRNAYDPILWNFGIDCFNRLVEHTPYRNYCPPVLANQYVPHTLRDPHEQQRKGACPACIGDRRNSCAKAPALKFFVFFKNAQLFGFLIRLQRHFFRCNSLLSNGLLSCDAPLPAWSTLALE